MQTSCLNSGQTLEGGGLGRPARWLGGWPPGACPGLEPFPPQIQTPLPDSPELWTQARDRRVLVQGDVPSSAFCSRSWSPGPRTSAETLEFFNLKPKVHSPSLSSLHSFVPGKLHILSSHCEAHYHAGGISARCRPAEAPSRFLCRIAGEDKARMRQPAFKLHGWRLSGQCRENCQRLGGRP